MNAELLKKMAAWAGQLGLKLEITTDHLVLSPDGQDSPSPVALISLDQPQHEVIFSFLFEIGHFELHVRHPYQLRMPWFINRPFENEILGDATYKTRRLLRLKFGHKWQADFWALCAYRKIGCPDDLKAFLMQHPEKLPLFVLAITSDVISRITGSKPPRQTAPAP